MIISKTAEKLMFALTLMQDGTDKFHHPELVGEPLRLELNFTSPLEHVTKLNTLGERKRLIAVDKLSSIGKNL